MLEPLEATPAEPGAGSRLMKPAHESTCASPSSVLTATACGAFGA